MTRAFLLVLPTSCLLFGSVALATPTGEAKGHHVDLGTTMPTLINVGEDLEMYEAYAGYWVTRRDVVGLKATTWKLMRPLGIAYGPSLADEDENYPGRLWEHGLGFLYQRFLSPGWFAAFEIMPMKKVFLDEDKNQE